MDLDSDRSDFSRYRKTMIGTSQENSYNKQNSYLFAQISRKIANKIAKIEATAITATVVGSMPADCKAGVEVAISPRFLSPLVGVRVARLPAVESKMSGVVVATIDDVEVDVDDEVEVVEVLRGGLTARSDFPVRV